MSLLLLSWDRHRGHDWSPVVVPLQLQLLSKSVFVVAWLWVDNPPYLPLRLRLAPIPVIQKKEGGREGKAGRQNDKGGEKRR